MASKKEQKKRQDLTIMLLPQDGQVRRFVLSPGRQGWLRRFATGALLVLFALAGYTMVTASHLDEFFSLRRQVANQKEYLIQTEHKLAQLQDQIDRARIFEQKIRLVLGQAPAPGTQDFIGIGGPNAEEFDTRILTSDPQFFQQLEDGFSGAKLEGALAEIGLQELHSILEDQSSLLTSTPSIWPVRGWITSKFGRRTSPFTGLQSSHHGIDVAARQGTPIQAPADGLVVYAGIMGGYGKVVIVDHGYDVTTRFGHMSELGVRQGQTVRRGDIVGKVGSTGRSTAPHLHYEVRVRSVPVDPLKYILVE